MAWKAGKPMATAATKKAKLSIEEAAERVVDLLDRHLSRLPAKERARKLRKFYAGAKIRETRAK
jgi:hypothetical protein